MFCACRMQRIRRRGNVSPHDHVEYAGLVATGYIAVEAELANGTDLVIQSENATEHRARIEIFGEAVDANATRIEHSIDPAIAPGTLLLTFGSQFRVTVEDTVTCPQTNPPSLHGSTALYILDGNVHGGTTDDVACSVEGKIPYARFFFDMAGERVDN
jgi:hypothetical protein